MRIGVDARLMHHQKAGISKYTWHLLQALSSLDLDEEFIIFQHRKQREEILRAPNFRRATLYAPVHHALEQWMLPVELLRFNLTLLHSTDFIPPLRTHIPTVITVHDLAFLHYPHFLTSSSAAYYGQIDRAARSASHIIVPSEQTRNDLVGILGTPTDKISVIYEAAAEMFQPLPLEETRASVQRDFGLPSQYFLFVGTIEPRKNIIGLLQAFQYLKSRYAADENHGASVRNVALAIAGGKGWLYEETLESVRRLGIERDVHFVGRVSDEQLHRLYVGARALVHPAHYEGFGLPPLEAMACGTPVIVSNVSSLPEVVQDAALLVDPSEPEEIAVAMHRLLTDDGLRAELIEKGRQRAASFSWQRAAIETLAVYHKVADAHAPSAPRVVSSAKES